MVTLPRPQNIEPAEDFAPAWGERECVEIEDRPGVVAFRDFVMKHLGGRKGWIGGRPCMSTGHQSGHYSARAWDWMISAEDPAERERADALLAWLLENDAEMFRRVGLTYMIWDRKRWSPRTGKWVPYDGYDADGNCPSGSCRHPHHDHVHFSFGKAGADGDSSFYRWVTSSDPQMPTQPPSTPSPAPGRTRAVVSLGLGALVGWFAASQIPRVAQLVPRRRR